MLTKEMKAARDREIAEAKKNIFKAELLEHFLERNENEFVKLLNANPEYQVSMVQTTPWKRPNNKELPEWYVRVKTINLGGHQ